jgi:hypothetical protein
MRVSAIYYGLSLIKQVSDLRGWCSKKPLNNKLLRRCRAGLITRAARSVKKADKSFAA